MKDKTDMAYRNTESCCTWMKKQSNMSKYLSTTQCCTELLINSGDMQYGDQMLA